MISPAAPLPPAQPSQAGGRAVAGRCRDARGGCRALPGRSVLADRPAPIGARAGVVAGVRGRAQVGLTGTSVAPVRAGLFSFAFLLGARVQQRLLERAD